MPVQEDIMEHSVIGPAIRQGSEQGLERGRIEGQSILLLRLIQKRFGTIPPEIARHLAALKPAQLERAGLRLLDARRIEDLFTR